MNVQQGGDVVSVSPRTKQKGPHHCPLARAAMNGPYYDECNDQTVRPVQSLSRPCSARDRINCPYHNIKAGLCQ